MDTNNSVAALLNSRDTSVYTTYFNDVYSQLFLHLYCVYIYNIARRFRAGAGAGATAGTGGAGASSGSAGPAASTAATSAAASASAVRHSQASPHSSCSTLTAFGPPVPVSQGAHIRMLVQYCSVFSTSAAALHSSRAGPSATKRSPAHSRQLRSLTGPLFVLSCYQIKSALDCTLHHTSILFSFD